MNYLNDFIFDSAIHWFYFAETLRKYPVVAALPRRCAQDYHIPGTNKIIEKGVEVIVPVAGYHKDERYFTEPNKFDPDRFNEENSTGKNMINRPYYPFGVY